MSAYLVNDSCITNTINGIKELRKEGRLGGGLFAGINLDEKDAESRIGRLLVGMNERAVNACYPEEPMADAGYHYRASMPCRLVQSYKSAQCLRYQCSEGEEPNSDLYKALDSAVDAMAAELVSRMPEYGTATWG